MTAPVIAAAFVRALGIGIAIAAPVGPMSLLCMRRTLTAGWRAGFETGLGIATGDGIYALVAALGLAGLAKFMLAYDRPLHLLAGAFLILLGLRTFFMRPDGGAERIAPATGYASATLLTLTNPPTIVAFAAVFTVLAPSTGFDVAGALVATAGVFTGSALWWLVLTATVALARNAIGARTRRWIDRISGAVLAAFGAAEIRRAV